VAVRSSAVALAHSGDRDPLRTFLVRTHAVDYLERANLNYWAYWVGEVDAVCADDTFMTQVAPRHWTGSRLLRHLLRLVRPGSGHLELDVHTLWALLLAQPTLLTRHFDLRAWTATTIDELDGDASLGALTRREPSDISYAIRSPAGERNGAGIIRDLGWRGGRVPVVAVRPATAAPGCPPVGWERIS